jgi:hypothetical protein
MRRTRVAQLAAVVTATVTLTSLAVVSSKSHEQEQPAAKGQAGSPGPRRDAAVAMPPGLVGLQISLGLKDTRRTEWQGEVSVSEGRVLGLDIIRSAPDATVDGGRFRVESKKKVAAKKKKKQQQAVVLGPILHANLEAPETAVVTVRTDQGPFSFKPADLKLGQQTTFLDGEAAVERQDAAVQLTGRGTEDDFPAAARAPDGTVWLTYVEYHPERARMNTPVKAEDFDSLVPTKNGDTIRLRKFDGKTWHPAIDVTAGGLDVWRPTVGVDGQGTVWVAWAQQIDGDWEIFRRGYKPAGPDGRQGTWSDVVRMTSAKGSDFHVVSATDSQGTVWLAWQAFRSANYEILATTIAEGATVRVVSSSPANDWGPAIAAGGNGSVYVAWDTYDKGNYDVLLRDIGRGSEPIVVAASPRFEARPSVVCDKSGRVWIAYEEGDEQWGKDFAHVGDVRNVGQEKNPGFALYVNRTVKVKCLADGRLMTPAGGAEPKFARIADRNKSVPRLALDGEGGLWLFLRHHPLPGKAGEVWVGSASHFDGAHWSPLRTLTSSANLIDNRPALAAVDGGLIAVYSGDHRQNTQTRTEDDLYVARLVGGSHRDTPEVVADEPAPAATLATVHPDEPADVARMRLYRAQIGGKTLRPLRGEFHRHTEVSSHNDQDGLLEDAWRYALDAASHDWMGNGDHDNGFGFEYMWWFIQKMTDLHHNPPTFVAAQTYERSVVYPDGHRNVMMPKRGVRPLPRGNMVGTDTEGTPDTKVLYAYLKHFGGICASHTSATDMGTDWRDNDPEVEPVVEIYQGHRHNYEHFGAPRSATEATQIGGYRPKGFVWNAFEKGYKLGFQSSSDHVSTHWSYAVVFAEDTSRPAIIDAFKKRHCYAATDNILLDVRSGANFMGDTFTTRERPSLEILAAGTGPIARLHVIRNNKYIFSTEPRARDVKLVYKDDSAVPGNSYYYYVRVEQADGNLAWGSPMWVSYAR